MKNMQNVIGTLILATTLSACATAKDVYTIIHEGRMPSGTAEVDAKDAESYRLQKEAMQPALRRERELDAINKAEAEARKNEPVDPYARVKANLCESGSYALKLSIGLTELEAIDRDSGSINVTQTRSLVSRFRDTARNFGAALTILLDDKVSHDDADQYCDNVDADDEQLATYKARIKKLNFSKAELKRAASIMRQEALPTETAEN